MDLYIIMDIPGGVVIKNSPASARDGRDAVSILGWKDPPR